VHINHFPKHPIQSSILYPKAALPKLKAHINRWNSFFTSRFSQLQAQCTLQCKAFLARQSLAKAAVTLKCRVVEVAIKGLKCFTPKKVQLHAALLPSDPALMTKRMDNGFTYYIRHNAHPFPQRAHLELVVRAGFLNETAAERGIAHLIEHMTQHETESFTKGEIDKYLASKGVSWGGDSNAYTNSTSTVYQLNIPLDEPELLDKALFILSEVAQKATLSDNIIEAEREIVIDELRLNRNASNRYRSTINPKLLEGTPYAELFDLEREIGNIKSCPTDTVRNFYKRWYQPENISVVAVGDFDTEQVSQMIEKHFGKMPTSNHTPSRHDVITKASKEAQFVAFTDPEITHSSVEIYNRLSPVERNGKVTLHKTKRGMITALGIGMLNQRFKEMQSQPSPPFIRASGWVREIIPRCPYFGLNAVGRDGELAKSYKQLLMEIKRIQTHGFTESEFKRIKANMLAALEHMLAEKNKTSTSSFIEIYKNLFLQNVPAPAPDKLCELQKDVLKDISLREINHLFATLPLDKQFVATALPQTPEMEEITPDVLQKMMEEVKNEAVSPYVDEMLDRPLLAQVPVSGTIISARRYEETGVTEYMLSNGMRVLVKPTTFMHDQVALHAFALRGSRSVPADKRFTAMFSEDFYDCCGIAHFELSDLLKYLSGKNVSFDSKVNGYTTELSISSGKKDLETALQLFYLAFSDPGYSKKAFNTAITNAEQTMCNPNSNPFNVFLKAVVSVNTQNHPEFEPMSDEDLKEIDYETCKNLHQQMFSNPADYTLGIVGNVDEAEIKRLIERYMASLPQKGERHVQYTYPPVTFPPGITHAEVRAGKEEVCVTCLTFPAAHGDTMQENWLSSWCCELLNRRLIEVLRKQLGKTYTPSCSFQRAAIPTLSASRPSTSQIILSCDQNHLQELETALLNEIRAIQEGKLTSEELSDFKKNLSKDLVDGFQTNKIWLNAMLQCSLWNGDLNNVEACKKHLETLGHEAVTQHFKKLFKLDNYSMVTLLPENVDLH